MEGKSTTVSLQAALAAVSFETPRCETRVFAIGRTCVSIDLAPAFWQVLDRMCRETGTPLADIVAQIAAECPIDTIAEELESLASLYELNAPVRPR